MADGVTAGRVSPVRAALLVASLCTIYVMSQFLRNSVGVIAPELSRELALSPEEIGLLSSILFFSFAACQIPVGVAIDRYGPQRCLLACAAITVIGCTFFAVAGSMAGLTAARVIMGVGCSAFLMGSLTIYTRWFEPARFAILTGLQFGIGNLGTLLATAPLALSAAAIGWRSTFLAAAALTAALTVLVALFVRDAPPGRGAPAKAPQTLAASFAGLADVARVPGVWRMFTMHLFSYGGFISVLGLWGGPFLTDVHGLDLRERGNALLLMAVTHVCGMFLWGALDRHFASRRALATVGVLGTAATLTALAIFGGSGGLPAVHVLFAILGGVAGYVPVLMAQSRSLFTPDVIGRALTMLNVAAIGGVFVMQFLTGAIIGLFEPVAGAAGEVVRPYAAYRAVFLFLAAGLVWAWLVYRTAPDRR